MTDRELQIFLVSDGTGETVERVLRATLTQFRNRSPSELNVSRYKSIRTHEQVEAILEEADRIQAVVVYTAVSEEVRHSIQKGLQKYPKLFAVDVLGPLTDVLSKYLEAAPSSVPGLLHEVNEQYFQRIEAMEFAVKNDDGAHPENLERADLILCGVSRTSKTPLSIFLSHRGWKVANVPLVKGIAPPKTLFEIDQGKVVGLIIDPESLARIRRERLIRMGRDPAGDYASLVNIREEIEWSREIFARNRRWPVFDVTNKALEETAGEIERVVRRRKPSSTW